MSYDLEFNGAPQVDTEAKKPLLPTKRIPNGASLTEIQSNLDTVSRNITKLTNFAQQLGNGKMSDQDRDRMSKILKDTTVQFKKASELLENYK